MQCAEYYGIDKSCPAYLRLLRLIQRIRMQRARVFGCRKVRRLEENIESLLEQIDDAVNEFDAAHSVPACAIFNHIESGVTLGRWEYRRALGDDEPILKWDNLPNPDSEAEAVGETPLTSEQIEQREKLVAFIKSRR